MWTALKTKIKTAREKLDDANCPATDLNSKISQLDKSRRGL